MLGESQKSGHSAHVAMRLLPGGQSLSVAQSGPDFLLVCEPTDHPLGPAVMVLQVDQSERRWNVYLPDGISAGSERVGIAPGLLTYCPRLVGGVLPQPLHQRANS